MRNLGQRVEDKKKNWLYDGLIRPCHDYERCLLSLLRGHADANVVSEFSVLAQDLVPTGGQMNEAKDGAT